MSWLLARLRCAAAASSFGLRLFFEFRPHASAPACVCRLFFCANVFFIVINDVIVFIGGAATATISFFCCSSI
jgi:hypothetical protein